MSSKIVEEKSKIHYLLIVPDLIAWLVIMMRSAVTLFWLGPNSDPAYRYIFNSVYVIDHLFSPFDAHFGTPMRILGVQKKPPGISVIAMPAIKLMGRFCGRYIPKLFCLIFWNVIIIILVRQCLWISC